MTHLKAFRVSAAGQHDMTHDAWFLFREEMRRAASSMSGDTSASRKQGPMSVHPRQPETAPVSPEPMVGRGLTDWGA